jgi:hypothetical protein
MKRRIFAFDSVEAARSAVNRLRNSGVADKHISVIARSDIELERVPNELLDVSSDVVPAVGRGAAMGGATGLFAGIVAMAIPPLGIAIGGPVLIGFLAGGAALGAWSSALVGASVPNDIRRTFEDEIETGRILLVVDSERDDNVHVRGLMVNIDDGHLVWQSETEAPAAA